MKLNDLYGGVPENVSQRIEKTVMGLPEKEVKERGIRLSRPLAIALSCVVAIVLMTATVFTVGLLTDREEREQQYVDPYAEQIMESVTDNGITMTLNKIAMDFNTDYIYFTLKNENGIFEKQPEFDEISFTNEHYTLEIESKYGSLRGFTTLSASDYDPENPSDTIHAVMREHLPFGKMTLNFNGLKSTDGTIDYADGFSFDIDIGTNRRVINDIIERSGFDEEDINNEFKNYDKKSEVLDYQFIDLDKTIEIEGCELKALSMYVSPYQISLNLRDDMSKSVKIGELEYYPATLTTISTDYPRAYYSEREYYEKNKIAEKIISGELAYYKPDQHFYAYGDCSTKDEIDYKAEMSAAQRKIWDEQGADAWTEYSMNHDFRNTDEYKKIEKVRQNPEYFDMLDAASYKIGVEFAPGSEASLIGLSFGETGFYRPEDSEDWLLAAGVSAHIDRAVSIDEIQRIYFYKYSDPSVQVDVWVNK